MRRTTAIKMAAAGSALALLSVGGAAAFADTEDPAPTAVVNKNGHEVDEHAAFGQARAAEARAQRLEKAAERDAEDETEDSEVEETETEVEDTEVEETETDDTEVEDPEVPAEEKTDNGNHGGPDEHAGDHPNPKAFENPQPRGPKDGHGPNEHAGDHPNENATNGPGNQGQGKK